MSKQSFLSIQSEDDIGTIHHGISRGETNLDPKYKKCHLDILDILSSLFAASCTFCYSLPNGALYAMGTVKGLSAGIKFINNLSPNVMWWMNVAALIAYTPLTLSTFKRYYHPTKDFISCHCAKPNKTSSDSLFLAAEKPLSTLSSISAYEKTLSVSLGIINMLMLIDINPVAMFVVGCALMITFIKANWIAQAASLAQQGEQNWDYKYSWWIKNFSSFLPLQRAAVVASISNTASTAIPVYQAVYSENKEVIINAMNCFFQRDITTPFTYTAFTLLGLGVLSSSYLYYVEFKRLINKFSANGSRNQDEEPSKWRLLISAYNGFFKSVVSQLPALMFAISSLNGANYLCGYFPLLLSASLLGFITQFGFFAGSTTKNSVSLQDSEEVQDEHHQKETSETLYKMTN